MTDPKDTKVDLLQEIEVDFPEDTEGRLQQRLRVALAQIAERPTPDITQQSVCDALNRMLAPEHPGYRVEALPMDPDDATVMSFVLVPPPKPLQFTITIEKEPDHG